MLNGTRPNKVQLLYVLSSFLEHFYNENQVLHSSFLGESLANEDYAEPDLIHKKGIPTQNVKKIPY